MNEISQPIVSSQACIYFLLIFVLGGIAGCAWHYARTFWTTWRMHRADEQLEDELRMRAGWRELKRRGWLPEDLQ